MSLSVLPSSFTFFFFFNDTATTEIYTLSLHDALPIWTCSLPSVEDKSRRTDHAHPRCQSPRGNCGPGHPRRGRWRSEEHTSELQSRQYLVCRLLLEKKQQIHSNLTPTRQCQRMHIDHR